MATEQHISGGAVTGHTPGPWEVDGEAIVADAGSVVANVLTPDDFPCFGDDEGDDVEAFEAECGANARLIAAAPDLLAACKAALADELESRNNGGFISDGTVATLRAAIARATGAP